MKRLLLLTLAAIPLFAFSVNFIYNDYDNYEDDCWYDEYWDDDYWSDGYWVYYPHGYYCVHYVWWYPWWWGWYWDNCHWCHHFSWDFFYSGFYVVWYEDGGWWYRPRYGHWVRYQLPHSYYTIRYNAGQHGITLPAKPPREINLTYNENQVMRLSRQQNPELFTRVEKEHKSGNLEKMRKEYDTKIKKEITKKNEEYRAKNSKSGYIKSSTIDKSKSNVPQAMKSINNGTAKKQYTITDNKKSKSYNDNKSHIVKQEKTQSRSESKTNQSNNKVSKEKEDKNLREETQYEKSSPNNNKDQNHLRKYSKSPEQSYKQNTKTENNEKMISSKYKR